MSAATKRTEYRDDQDVTGSQHLSRILADVVADSLPSRPVIYLPIKDSRCLRKFGSLLLKNLLCKRCNKPVNSELLACRCEGYRKSCNCFVFKDEAFGWTMWRYFNRRAKSDYGRENRERHTDHMAGAYTNTDLEQLYGLQKGRCYFCGVGINREGSRKYQIDHLQPMSRNGSAWPDNLALVCKSCNNDKNNNSEQEYWRTIRKVKGENVLSSLQSNAARNRVAKRLMKRACVKTVKSAAAQTSERLASLFYERTGKTINVSLGYKANGFILRVGRRTRKLIPSFHRKVLTKNLNSDLIKSVEDMHPLTK